MKTTPLCCGHKPNHVLLHDSSRFRMRPGLTSVWVALLWITATAQEGLSLSFSRMAPRVDGAVSWGEWEGATRIELENGFVAVQNDNDRLYMLVDVLAAVELDSTDYIWLSFDVNGDREITPNVDLNYTQELVTRDLRYQYYLGPFSWSGLQPLTCSSKAERFESFLADGSTRVGERMQVFVSPHRVWELGIDLKEIGARPGDKVRFGLRVASPRLQILEEKPAGFAGDFSNLLEITLSQFGAPIIGGAAQGVSIGFEPDPIEVTQAIQTRKNTLPLVQEKSTVARVYVSMSGTSEAQPVTVCLFGKRNGQALPGSPLKKARVVPPTANRAHLQDTPYFELPKSWTQGTINLQARVRHDYGGSVDSAAVSVTFTPKQVPTYWIVPLNYGTVDTPNLASAAEIASQQSYLRAVFPLPDVKFLVKPWTAVGVVTDGDPMPRLNDYYNQVLLSWVLGLLSSGKAPFEMPKQIYGFRPSGGGLSDPIWCGGRGYVGWGHRGSSMEGTMAHEINHNLDRSTVGAWGRHTPMGCGAKGPDQFWPYPDSNIQEVGVDVRSPLEDGDTVGVLFPDFMSYCQSGLLPTKWISPYRWNNLFNAFPNVVSADPQGDERQVKSVYYISGSVNRDGTGQLDPVFEQPGFPSEEIAPGEYALDLLDAVGRVVRSIPFMGLFEDVEGNEVDVFKFNFQIAAEQGVAAIALRSGRTLLATISASRSAPMVTVLEPNGGGIWNGPATIAWAASDPDGDPLSFDILYTANDGATWVPVVRRLSGSSYAVDSSLLPGGTQARIRVIVTDGFHTRQDDSDRTFTVTGKPPRPQILRPQAGVMLMPGEPIWFETDAQDLEDGELPDPSCFWSYQDEVFGIGRRAEAVLPEGNHNIKLTLVDSEQNSSELLWPVRVVMAGPRLYVNCGGSSNILDVAGRVWRPADPFLTFGHPTPGVYIVESGVNTLQLTDPYVPAKVLQSEHVRDGNLNYQVPVPPGSYRVVLYFSVNDRSLVGPRLGGAGCASCARIFNVRVEDQRVADYNPADAAAPPAHDGAGHIFTATELVFDVSVADNILDIEVSDLGTGNPPGDAALQGFAIFNKRLSQLSLQRKTGGRLTVSWPAGSGGTLQMARDVSGPYTDADFPARLEGEEAVVDLPANLPATFLRLKLAP